MFYYFKKYLEKIPRNAWILLVIILIGIFLRTYRFHDWLEMEGDQTRDATLVHEVIAEKSPWPLLGPTINNSSSINSNKFRVGPIYYYFQIISAKIFGDYPDKLAYPDLFFAILSIPLFYLFFKRYFSRNLSLALTGLYAISFFAVHYSRFAWNPNSIPFFVLLFLLALYEFAINKENVGWIWAIALGIALGVGIQLHAIIFLLFPIVAFFVLIFSLKRNWRIWNKWAVVLAVFLVLNLGQIISEAKTNFSNSKILLHYFSREENKNEDAKDSDFLLSLKKNVKCHIKINAYALSSIGEENCSLDITAPTNMGKFFNIQKTFFLLGSLIFSFFGYFLLTNYCSKETKKDKKYFLRLIALYLTVAFLIMLAANQFNLRYLNCVFFAPFMFLGFFIDYFYHKFLRLRWALIIPLFILFIVSNTISLASAAKELSEKGKTGYHSNFLAQIEPLAQYLIANSNGNKIISLDGKNAIMDIYYPLIYFMEKQGITLVRKSENNIILPLDAPSFYIGTHAPNNIAYKKIGQVYISKIQN